MEKILLAVDFSKHTPALISVALDLSYFLGTRLHILHVTGMPNHHIDLPNLDLEKVKDQKLEALKMQMEEFTSADFQKIKITLEVKIGFPGTVIQDIAEREEADLIIMGMASKTKERIIGSIAIQVLNESDISVFLVPPGFQYQGIDHILYCGNFDFRDLGAVNYFSRWLKAFDATFTYTHFVDSKEKESEAAFKMKLLKDTYKQRKRIKTQVLKGGTFRDAMMDFAKLSKADLVVYLSKRKTLLQRFLGLDSVEDMIQKTVLPVMVIKDKSIENREEEA